VCDFGISRQAEKTKRDTIHDTRPLGTDLYMPPEAYSRVAQRGSRRPRDIWSFGVLVCEVSIRAFFSDIGRNHPEGLDGLIRSAEFPEKVAETARTLSWAGEKCRVIHRKNFTNFRNIGYRNEEDERSRGRRCHYRTVLYG